MFLMKLRSGFVHDLGMMLDLLCLFSRPLEMVTGMCTISEAVSAKIEDGNIRAAVRILCSDGIPALPSAVDMLAVLQVKHPTARNDLCNVADPRPDCQLVFDEQAVLHVLRCFPVGSSGGPDGLRPQRLLVLVRCRV
jgi:hypothetical protein